jgi:hypothetical protein
MTIRSQRCNRGGPRAGERIEDDVIAVRVELDQPFRQFDRERSGVPDAGGALGGDVPNVERCLHELVLEDRDLGGEALLLTFAARQGSVEATFGGDDHTFGDVP